jgi:hypothetical protein
MNHRLFFLTLGLLALPAAATANAAETDCTQLELERARTEQAKRSALEQGDKAWKAIVPFVVLARKASSKAAADEADQKLAGLRQQSLRLECSPPNRNEITP